MNDESCEEKQPAQRSRTAKRKQGNSGPEGFEDAMARLEALVRKMESGNENLADMVESFEEGRALLAYCNKSLSEIERKVEILVKGENGTVSAEPFSETPAD